MYRKYDIGYTKVVAIHFAAAIIVQCQECESRARKCEGCLHQQELKEQSHENVNSPSCVITPSPNVNGREKKALLDLSLVLLNVYLSDLKELNQQSTRSSCDHFDFNL